MVKSEMQEDLFEMWVWLKVPVEVESVRVMFGVGTDFEDYYYFDFPVSANESH